jgi:Rrf2 family nitric oxide-sensitive transcriptional repressor
MSLLSRKVDYALLILSYLHHKQEGGSAQAIAARFGLSRSFVANILKELCHQGFVTSRRGTHGGYLLRRPAETITLAEVMDSLEDAFHLAACCRESPGEGCFLFGVCPIQGPIAEVHRRLRDVLGKVRLAELFGPPAAGPVELEVSRCRQMQPVN